MDQNLGNFLSFMGGEDLFTIERPRKQRKTMSNLSISVEKTCFITHSILLSQI